MLSIIYSMILFKLYFININVIKLINNEYINNKNIYLSYFIIIIFDIKILS